MTSTAFLAEEKANSRTAEDDRLVRNLPEINLPEKILLVIDVTRNNEFTPFLFDNGATCTPLAMLKTVVGRFVRAKSGIDLAHEFALMKMGADGAQWVCRFNDNPKVIANQLETLAEEILDDDQRTYDLGQLFETIEAGLFQPSVNRDELPKFVTRVILLYARSNAVPRFHTGQKHLDNLTANPYFFLDAMFVHEPLCEENACEEVYAGITALDVTNFSYIFEVTRNPVKLHDNMAKLLAHPLQRPPQKDARYTISCENELPELHTNV